MTVTFVSNYLTLHQIPFCQAMYAALGDGFRFVSTQPMEAERISMGWQNAEVYPFELDIRQAGDLIDESDIVLIGSASDALIQNRLKANKPVIRYSERILKNGRFHVLSPKAMVKMARSHTRYAGKNVWLLCASAYAAGDYGLFGAYWRKCYKWGYFPKTHLYSDSELLKSKNGDTVRILWCGRFLRWKHPEAAVLAAMHLQEKGIPFHIDIVGDGEMRQELDALIDRHRLMQAVTLHGFLPPAQVREFMKRANIYLFTSDFYEGWGAVLNEAMNSGCAVVASHAIGAAPYLISDGENGFLYRSGDTAQLCRRVEALAKDQALCSTVGQNAYRTIAENWNADVAAERFLQFCQAIGEGGHLPEYPDGPMSKAGFLSNHWYREKKRGL